MTGSGKFKTSEEIAKREAAGTFRFGMGPTAEERAMSETLAKVASQLPGNPAPASVAQAWSMSKVPYVFPLVGGTNPEHLKANIEVCESFSNVLSEDLTGSYKSRLSTSRLVPSKSSSWRVSSRSHHSSRKKRLA